MQGFHNFVKFTPQAAKPMDYLKELSLEKDLIAKISEQKDKIEQQQKALGESLEYASSIQSALLPDLRYLYKIFPESFVLFKPRDIVSGDFYWYARKGNRVAVTAADCTGHGVPGAFMSMLGISFLNEIVSKNIPKANTILNRLRENVMKALHQTGELTENKDGMDISLCVIDLDDMLLNFAGAFNPLYLVRDGNLLETRGDKMPIGINAVVEKSFRNHSVKLEAGDQIYLFSDGYPDQFGGPHDKKFKYRALKELLVRIHKKPMDSQKKELERSFIRWKADNEQVDDVLLIGIKI
jgi:serine phosphatase RsbU (regulator of sigma subunit)